MGSQHLSEYPFPELLHGVSSLNLETRKQSPATTPSKSPAKQRSPLRAEAPSFVPSNGFRSPTRPQPRSQYQNQSQSQQQPRLSSKPQTQLHHRSQSQPHSHFHLPSPRKHHPHHHPLPPIPRVTLSRHEICLYFGMDDIIDDFYEDVVRFLYERPQGKSEDEALEFYLEFVAGGGERHKSGETVEGVVVGGCDGESGVVNEGRGRAGDREDRDDEHKGWERG
ncbi:hypothetical protein DL98DRAFT_528912 [Cadophora sp. DSE1049]|nr:hypothetical protein DL98DRAFT_528912 [Cadophora sp. DSE1049]